MFFECSACMQSVPRARKHCTMWKRHKEILFQVQSKLENTKHVFVSKFENCRHSHQFAFLQDVFKGYVSIFAVLNNLSRVLVILQGFWSFMTRFNRFKILFRVLQVLS